MNTSSKPEPVKDPRLKEIIADSRKALRNRLHSFWNRVDIIINNAWEELCELEKFVQVRLLLNSPDKNGYIKENLEYIFNTLIKYQEKISSKEDMIDYEKLINTIISLIEEWELDQDINSNFAEAESKWIAKRHEFADHIMKYQKRVIYKQQGKVCTYRVDIKNKKLELEALEMIWWNEKSRGYKYTDPITQTTRRISKKYYTS